MVKAHRKEGTPEQRFTAGKAVKKISGFLPNRVEPREQSRPCQLVAWMGFFICL
jgi:hypothetical protein